MSGINLNTIKKRFFDWVYAYVELDDQRIFWTDQNIGLPTTGPFITMHLLSGPAKLGSDSFRSSNEDIAQFGPRELTVSIQAFREGASSRLIDLQASVDERHISYLYFSNELSILRATPIRNTSTLRSDDFLIEERSGFDITALTQYYRSSKSEVIEKVSVDGGET